ncbi:cupin domain-containing protein [Nitrospira sp. T9]|uniref:cupin domain-containing protein n=1 Tax=unclassified Nitrospira TaxID=2652172 RepID=UPI00207F1CF1|nr:MAG: hypothetical protein NPIRA03_38930 [Nitrospirales bacterium]
MEEIIHHTDYINWAEIRGFPGPADGKMLRDDPSTGARAMLVRIPPGGEIIPHGHRGIVQHYILQGQYESDGKLFGQGCYRMIPAHIDIPPMTTENGVTILMIYDPVA